MRLGPIEEVLALGMHFLLKIRAQAHANPLTLSLQALGSHAGADHVLKKQKKRCEIECRDG